MEVMEAYEMLLEKYGRQGWWPLLEVEGSYHPGNYSLPKTKGQKFEVCAGAILTQNTSWKNVEKALLRLKDEGLLDAERIAKADEERVELAIRSSGYYRQKARKIKEFAKFFLGLGGRTPERKELLSLWGIGPETADSILLYAYHEPEFVVDAYTKRFCSKYEICGERRYGELKKVFEGNLPKDEKVYKEFHALIVRWGKGNRLKE